MSVASFLLKIIEAGFAAHPASPAPAASVAKGVANTADESVLVAIEHVVMGTATSNDAITLVNAILAGVEFIDPATAPLVTLAIDLEPIAEVLIASGAVSIKPGASGEGQTAASSETHGRYVGR